MIINTIKGGLGNQMFQWACGRNLSIKYKMPVYLDTSYYKISNSNRNFELFEFPHLKYIDIDKLDTLPDYSTINEPPNFEFRDFPTEMNSNFRLEGYWQTEKFFIDIKELIIEEFSMTDETKKRLVSKYHEIGKDSVSIHVRRTDYVSSNGFHPLQNIEYYIEGLSIIKNYKNIFIFSDDIDWCKKNFNFKNSFFVEGNSNVEDLWLMTLCNHNIIANSSFSWWGAYLNMKSDRKVIYPKNWFGNFTGINTSLICPNNWIKI